MEIQVEVFTAAQIAAKINEQYMKASDGEKLIHIIADLENKLQSLQAPTPHVLHPQLGTGLGGRVLPFPQRGIIDIGPTPRETEGVGRDGDGGQYRERVRETDNRPTGPTTPAGVFPTGPHVAGEPA